MDVTVEDQDMYDAIQLSLFDYNTQKLENYHKRSLQQKLEDMEKLFTQPLWIIEDRILMNHEDRAKYLMTMRQEARRDFEKNIVSQESKKIYQVPE